MKLRHPWLIKTAGCGIALLLRAWIGSLRYQHHALGTDAEPPRVAPGTRYLYAFWHEYLLLPAFRYAFTDATILIGQHADGQLITEVCRHLGLRAARGCTTRNGDRAVRHLMNETHGHIVITPDGPRGPRRVVKPGLVYLASRLGLPIVPAGFGLERPWRGRSWDRFAMPRPGSRACVVTDELVRVPATADRDTLEVYRLHVQAAINRATTLAERWAAEKMPPHGALPLPAPALPAKKLAG